MPKKQSKELKELLDKSKRQFKLATEAIERQRERELEDLEFQVEENQWTPEARKLREGGDLYPARPMLSISQLVQPLQLIANQASNSDLGVEIHAVSEKADDELAEIKQGLYRRIERDSNASLARLWALDRATQVGRGFYRINTQYDEDGDHPLDQEISIERIFDQASVYMDPGATSPDMSDARFGGVSAWVPTDTFQDMFPGATVPQNEADFKDWRHEDPEWIKSDGEQNAVLVAEHFYKKTEYIDIPVTKEETRQVEVVQVWYCKLTSMEVIEGPTRWPGKHIPIIPVIGKELQPFSEERRWEGIVRKARDGQRLFNVAASNLVERMDLEPKVPWVGAEGQFDGHEEEWGQSNSRNPALSGVQAQNARGESGSSAGQVAPGRVGNVALSHGSGSGQGLRTGRYSAPKRESGTTSRGPDGSEWKGDSGASAASGRWDVSLPGQSGQGQHAIRGQGHLGLDAQGLRPSGQSDTDSGEGGRLGEHHARGAVREGSGLSPAGS